MKRFLGLIAAAWEKHVVADDPNPSYSRLDRLDGLDDHGTSNRTPSE